MDSYIDIMSRSKVRFGRTFCMDLTKYGSIKTKGCGARHASSPVDPLRATFTLA
ncbi:hypothetical protein KIN20_033643 [Parelaphostrongylus tenuis]|uniref:Uncharacterized protein n=1 Tax=Parelaphostrongylus tenuis TaxID=148309 RepID=A0AAD5R8P3_PARTN|nr:hypothetical protein KIN20_033643 [Parelaphostrongylus tenuis]